MTFNSTYARHLRGNLGKSVLVLLLIIGAWQCLKSSSSTDERAAAPEGTVGPVGDGCGNTQPHNGNLVLRDCKLTELPTIASPSAIKFLDIGGNLFTQLPDLANLGFDNLDTLFVSGNRMALDIRWPLPPRLRVFGAKNSGIREIRAGVLPRGLEWLILTGNKLTELPRDAVNLTQLKKVALANNQLTTIPEEIGKWAQLELLRLGANADLTELPTSLLELPQLAWLGLGRSGVASRIGPPDAALPLPRPGLLRTSWQGFEGPMTLLGKGASGTGYRTQLQGRPVVVKHMHSTVGTDGNAAEELMIQLVLDHPCITRAVATGEEQGKPFIVLEDLPGSALVGSVPSLASITRDTYSSRPHPSEALRIVGAVAKALQYLHIAFSPALGIAHGDVYAHNILVGRDDAAVKTRVQLSDFGAAFVYDKRNAHAAHAIQRFEVRAWGILAEELIGSTEGMHNSVRALITSCIGPLSDRPSFDEIVDVLGALVGALS